MIRVSTFAASFTCTKDAGDSYPYTLKAEESDHGGEIELYLSEESLQRLRDAIANPRPADEIEAEAAEIVELGEGFEHFAVSIEESPRAIGVARSVDLSEMLDRRAKRRVEPDDLPF